ncbi:MAG: alpha/beta hydrolase [Gemmataceae bacterium]
MTWTWSRKIGSTALIGILGLLTAPTARAEDAPSSGYEVRVLRDIAYHNGDDADPVKHKLDVFVPRDCKDFPVLFFVHGGAWQRGDKSGHYGVYSALGMFMAKHGVGTVVTNYRLSPTVKHPEHIKDVARAFAWTYRNIARYGGRPDQIFTCGHSAGGHLVALLATDEQYLKAHELPLNVVKGVIPISGVFTIPERLLTGVFGNDPRTLQQASPQTHVRPDAPPFLILFAESDYPTLDQMAKDFGKALAEQKVPAIVQEIKDRSHITIILRACVENDPTNQAILRFIALHSANTVLKATLPPEEKP